MKTKSKLRKKKQIQFKKIVYAQHTHHPNLALIRTVHSRQFIGKRLCIRTHSTISQNLYCINHSDFFIDAFLFRCYNDHIFHSFFF